jgi:hypothetical protein
MRFLRVIRDVIESTMNRKLIIVRRQRNDQELASSQKKREEGSNESGPEDRSTHMHMNEMIEES